VSHVIKAHFDKDGAAACGMHRRIEALLLVSDPEDVTCARCLGHWRDWAALRPCGTLAAYRRHLRHSEKPCEPCAQANRRDWADRRARNRRRLPDQQAPRPDQGRPVVTARPWQGTSYTGTEPCGTLAACRRHYRHGEKPCEACKAADRRDQRERRAARAAEIRDASRDTYGRFTRRAA
jgi:hypothetical protein